MEARHRPRSDGVRVMSFASSSSTSSCTAPTLVVTARSAARSVSLLTGVSMTGDQSGACMPKSWRYSVTRCRSVSRSADTYANLARRASVDAGVWGDSPTSDSRCGCHQDEDIGVWHVWRGDMRLPRFGVRSVERGVRAAVHGRGVWTGETMPAVLSSSRAAEPAITRGVQSR